MRTRVSGPNEDCRGSIREKSRRMNEKHPETQHGGDSSLNPANSDCLSRKEQTGRKLVAQAELLYDSLITVGIVSLEVIQQATALADQHEKTTTRTVVFLVRFEVLRQMADALAQ